MYRDCGRERIPEIPNISTESPGSLQVTSRSEQMTDFVRIMFTANRFGKLLPQKLI